MGLRERVSKLLSSGFTEKSTETIPTIPAELTKFGDVENPSLRSCLSQLDDNIAARINKWPTWASYMSAYYGLFTEPCGAGTTEVRKLYSQFREERIILPDDERSERTNQWHLAYQREHLLAIGALIWANQNRAAEDSDIVVITCEALGNSPIKDFIHESRPKKPRNRRHSGETAQQQDSVQEERIQQHEGGDARGDMPEELQAKESDLKEDTLPEAAKTNILDKIPKFQENEVTGLKAANETAISKLYSELPNGFEGITLVNRSTGTRNLPKCSVFLDIVKAATFIAAYRFQQLEAYNPEAEELDSRTIRISLGVCLEIFEKDRERNRKFKNLYNMVEAVVEAVKKEA